MAQVLFFGRMADIAGTRRTQVEAQSLFELRDAVFAEALATGQVTESMIRMSVNQVQVSADVVVSDGDEVAFFSVFSGG